MSNNAKAHKELLGCKVRHYFTKHAIGKITAVREDIRGYNYYVEWETDPEHSDWYQLNNLIKLEQPMTTPNSFDDELDEILLEAINEGWFLRSKGGYPNGWTGADVRKIQTKAKQALKSLYLTHRNAELRGLLEYAKGFITDVHPPSNQRSVEAVPVSVIQDLMKGGK